MADNLTDLAEARVINWATGNATTAPTLPLKLRLMSANGSDSTPGTEVANAGGSAYAAQSVTIGAATVNGGPVTNTADVTFTNMPATTVVGVEVWDSAGTPFRWWWGALSASKGTNLGDPATFLAGQLALTMG